MGLGPSRKSEHCSDFGKDRAPFDVHQCFARSQPQEKVVLCFQLEPTRRCLALKPPTYLIAWLFIIKLYLLSRNYTYLLPYNIRFHCGTQTFMLNQRNSYKVTKQDSKIIIIHSSTLGGASQSWYPSAGSCGRVGSIPIWGLTQGCSLGKSLINADRQNLDQTQIGVKSSLLLRLPSAGSCSHSWSSKYLGFCLSTLQSLAPPKSLATKCEEITPQSPASSMLPTLILTHSAHL